MFETQESRPVGANGTPALLVWPKAPGPHPCVLILHERYGLVPHTEDLARKLAAAGFVTVAPDLFYTHPDQEALHAGTIGMKPPDSEVLALLEDAYPLLKQAPGADPNRFGMIGVCQTGRYPLVWGAHHPLRAAVTLYGAAQASDWVVGERFPYGIEGLIERLAPTTSTLGIFGEGDHVISIDDVLRLRNTFEKHNKSYSISIYPDVPHGWLNDTMPGRYRPEAAKATWDDVIAFFTETLATEGDPASITWSFRSKKSATYDFSKNERYE